MAASDAHPAGHPLPGSSPVIGLRVPTAPDRRPSGLGGPPQFPPPPSERSAPSTPGSSSGLHSRIFTPSMAFTVTDSARLFLHPRPRAGTLTAGRLRLTLRTARSRPPKGFHAGLRPGPFPDRAASLLPGLLAATRTGLTPADDDELMSDHDFFIDLQLWAHSDRLCSTDAKARHAFNHR
jgi:hypothetical protein